MKILLINSVFGKGSTGTIVNQIHEYNLKNGVESIVCFGRGKKQKTKNIFKISSDLFSKFNSIRAKATGMVYSGNFFATNKLLRIIKKNNPDIVHIHNLNDQFVNEYKLLKFLATNKIKTVITLHSEQMYTGSCGYSFECTNWKSNGCKNCPYLKQSTNSNIDSTQKAFNRLKKCYDLFEKDKLVFTSVSNWILNRAKESILIGRFENQLIINGVSPTFEKENVISYKLNIPNKFALFVNPRLPDMNKGHQFIERLSKLTNDKLPIVVVGDCSNIDKVDNVLYIGAVYDRKKLAYLYSKASVTYLLSKSESYSMIIAESLMTGTPVVSFKCGGPEGTFSDEFVKFVNYGDVESFAKISLTLKVERNDVLKYSKANLTEEVMCRNYLRLYKEII